MNEIMTVGLDLAKNVFQVHGVVAELEMSDYGCLERDVRLSRCVDDETPGGRVLAKRPVLALAGLPILLIHAGEFVARLAHYFISIPTTFANTRRNSIGWPSSVHRTH